MVEKRIEAQRDLSESKKREKALESALQKNRKLSESKKRIVFLSEQFEDRESELQQIQHQRFAKDNILPNLIYSEDIFQLFKAYFTILELVTILKQRFYFFFHSKIVSN